MINNVIGLHVKYPLVLSHFNPLRTKLYLSNLKTQFVPRRKHFPPRL